MTPAPASPDRAPKIVFWFIWLAIFAVMSVARFQFAPETLAKRGDTAGMPDPAFLGVLIGALALSALVRVFMIPRQPESRKALVGFVLGLALAETPTMLASLLVPARAGLAYSASVGMWLIYLPALIRVVPNPRQDADTARA